MTKIWDSLLKHKILLLIVTLALLLRVYAIDQNPKSMYGDELTLVYDAYSILKTGHDQTGQFLPLFFSMGGGRPAGYIYATIPFVAIWGPTALAARSVSVASGIGVVLLMYLICSFILSKKIGLYAAFLASITPWELSLSRGSFETHFALFLGLLGWYFFIKAKKDRSFYIWSGLGFALAMQTYSTYVLTIPLFIVILSLYEGKAFFKSIIKNVMLWIFFGLIVSSLIFTIYTSIVRANKDRFSNLLIFNQPQIQNIISSKVQTEKLYSSFEPEIARKLHNKVVENANMLLDNYVGSFGFEFLFLQGDKGPRHNPANTGELYWVYLPLLVLGSIYLYSKNKKLLYLLGFWLTIAPLAATIVGPPHALRSSFMLPPLLVLTACGFFFVKKGKFILILLLIIQLPLFAERFYFLSPNLNASFWSYSAKRAAQSALKDKDKYDHIILSTSIPDMEFAYPVYAKIDPSDFRFQNSHKSYIGEYAFSKFGNFYIGSIPSGAVKEAMSSLSGSVLYLGPIEDRGMVENEGMQRDEADMPLFVISSKK